MPNHPSPITLFIRKLTRGSPLIISRDFQDDQDDQDGQDGRGATPPSRKHKFKSWTQQTGTP